MLVWTNILAELYLIFPILIYMKGDTGGLNSFSHLPSSHVEKTLR